MSCVSLFGFCTCAEALCCVLKNILLCFFRNPNNYTMILVVPQYHEKFWDCNRYQWFLVTIQYSFVDKKTREHFLVESNRHNWFYSCQHLYQYEFYFLSATFCPDKFTLCYIQLTVMNKRNFYGPLQKKSNFHFRVKENNVEYFHPGSRT